MLYVGLTEDNRESAKMFANMVGSQVISQSIPSSQSTELVVDNTSDESSSSLVSESETSNHQNGSVDQKPIRVPSKNIEVKSKNMTVEEIMKGYETCTRSLRSQQATGRASSFRGISPVNFSKETRLHVPKVVLRQIQLLNSLDIELYAYGKDIFSKKLQQMMQKLEIAEKQKSISSNVYGVPSRKRMQEKQESISGDAYGFPAGNL